MPRFTVNITIISRMFSTAWPKPSGKPRAGRLADGLGRADGPRHVVQAEAPGEQAL